MSERWVIDGSTGWLNARAVVINWPDEMGRLHYQGPVVQTGREFMPTQLRWMLNPRIGLPSQPFVVWRNRHPGGNPTKQELANLPDWEPIEIIGLPADDSWSDTPYSLEDQGPLDAMLRPVEAAMRRLEVGAPPIGWTRLAIGGPALPEWQPPDGPAFLRSMLEGRLLDGLHKMLRDTDKPTAHHGFLDREERRGDLRLMPRLILDDAVASIGNEPASSEWHPLPLLALSAGSDPYAALALGFGTAVEFSGRSTDILMVSVRHQLDPAGPEFELADVVRPADSLQAPAPPDGLRARRINHTRPQRLDGPGLDTIGIEWRRPVNPAYAPVPPDAAYPVSYVIGRFGPEMWRADLLITERPRDVGGWLAYAPSGTADARPMLFPHHLARATTVGNPPVVVPDVTGDTITYAVAAQDLFGRWSHWRTVAFETADELPQTPRILAVTLEPSGALGVDFGWDWSDRSPEFIELAGSYADAPATRILSARLDFAGKPEPVSGASLVVPLDQDMRPLPSWGALQDKDAAEPGTRYYRLATTIALDFAGQPWRDFQVRARGQCRVHQLAIPGFNVGPFGPPSVARVLDPLPPPPPKVPEAPQWASLPDADGVSRAVLRWDDVPGAAGYVVYEATETALLSALGIAGPDTAAAFTTRLAVLRAANLPPLRSVFRRVVTGLVPRGDAQGSLEVALPRGSRVMHFYAVTAMSPNNQESAWPDHSKKFIAVASPRLDVPPAPALEADPDPAAAAPTVRLRLELGGTAPGGTVEIYRIVHEQPASLDAMGPPIAVLNATGRVMSIADTTATRGWRRLWYRAVAWSARDDLNGLVEARSAASPPAAALLLPTTAPAILAVAVNEPGSSASETLVGWSSDAPVAATSLGHHRVVLEARDAAAALILRLEDDLDALTSVDRPADLPGPDPDHRQIVRVMQAASYRLQAWLPRPAPDQTFAVTIKMIDPLGRIGTATLSVPPLAAAPPVIDMLDPDSGRPGDSFTIFGSDLVVGGGSVLVSCLLPTEPGSPPDPGPLTIVGRPAPTEITVTVPPLPHDVRFHVVVTRSDGAEAVSDDKFTLNLL